MSTRIEYSEGRNTEIIFPTFVSTVYLPEYIDLAERMRLEFLTDKLKPSSQFWDVNSSSETAAELKKAFLKEGMPIVEKFFPKNTHAIQGAKRAWVNYNWPNQAEMPHHHGWTTMIGVFYIQTPDNAGDIVFVDPRGANEMTAFEEESLYNKTQDCRAFKRVTPKQGLMVFFPAFLIHLVETNLSRITRISIACNF